VDRLKALFYVQIVFIAYASYKLLVSSLYLLNFPNPLDYLSAAFYFVSTSARFYWDFGSYYQWHVEAMRTKLLANPSSFVLFALLIVFVLVCSTTARKFWKMYKRPIDVILEGIDYAQDKKTESAVRRLAGKLNVKPPKVFVTNSPRLNVLSAAMNPLEIFMIFAKSVVDSLDKDELESVVLHELWHIKTDVREVTRSALAFGDFTVMVPLATSPMMVFFYFFDPAFIGLHMVDFFAFLMFYLFFYYFLLFIDVSSLLGSIYPEYREYDADVASSLVTRKPGSLISVLKQLILLKFVESKFLALQFSAHGKDDLQVKRWKDLFRTKLAYPWVKYQHPSPFLRIKFLKLLDRLINKEVVLEIKRPLKRFSVFEISRNPLALFSPFGRRLRHLEKEKIKEVYDYMKNNSGSFDIRSCSKAKGIDEHDVLAIFSFLLMHDVIDVVNLVLTNVKKKLM